MPKKIFWFNLMKKLFIQKISLIILISLFPIKLFSFDTLDNYYKNHVLIIGDNVNIRAEPNLNSKVIYNLNIGHLVLPLKKINKKVQIDDKIGYWVYIDSGITENIESGRIKGWIFDNYLGYNINFTKINSWSIPNLKNIIYIDVQYDFIFNKDGSFTLTTSMSDGNCRETAKTCNDNGAKYVNKCKCLFTGHLYKYRNIIWAKLNSLVYGGKFYLLLDNQSLKLLNN
jgi:hypothetical protein